MIRDRDIRFVPHEDVNDSLKLGWMVAVPAFICHHDAYSVPMVWLCSCAPPRPERHRA